MKAQMAVGPLVTTLTLGCGTSLTYEECIQRLKAGTPHEQIVQALDTLNAAGTDAFPSLIAHFSDTTHTEDAFFAREIVDIAPDGTIRPHIPTVGEACFGVFQGQIEGNWPKGYRQYYVLTPENAQQWLDAHPRMTLAQLRVAAAEESLRLAEIDAAKDPQGCAWITGFLREHLRKAREGKWDGE